MDFLRMNPAGSVPVLRIDDLVLADSNAIFEYLEETQPEPALLPKNPALRAEARRLVAWFDDKFHDEVTANLLYERVNKKLAKSGYPESERIKAGTRNIKYHLDYIGWLMDHRRWLAGDMLTIADFAAAAHLSCLDYVGDVDWAPQPGAARVVREDQVAPGVPLDPRRPGAGLHPAAALCGPRLLRPTPPTGTRRAAEGAGARGGLQRLRRLRARRDPGGGGPAGRLRRRRLARAHGLDGGADGLARLARGALARGAVGDHARRGLHAGGGSARGARRGATAARSASTPAGATTTTWSRSG